MKAITTKYHGPTEHRGSRIIAKDQDGKKFILSEFGQFNHDNAHRAAAEGLRDKMGWKGDLISGGIKGGMVWVFAPAAAYNFTPNTALLNKLESWVEFHKDEGLGMNKFRGAWAQAAAEYFGQLTGSDVPEDAVSDLLGDLMHYCDRVKLDFDAELARAERHYREELAEIGEVSECQNCGEQWSEVDLKPVEDLGQRVAPGEPMPSGECPECGAVCHPVEQS